MFHDVRVLQRADTRDTGRLGGVMELYGDEFIAAGPSSDDARSPRAPN